VNDVQGSQEFRVAKSTWTDRVRELIKHARQMIDIRKTGADPILFWLAVLCLLGMVLSLLLLKAFDAGSWSAIVMWSSVGVGLFVSMIQIERSIDSISRLGAARLLWAAFLACIAYVSHGEAVGEVNEIFGVDASSLPHATAVATVLLLLKPTAVLLFSIGLIKLFLIIISSANGKPALILISFSVAFSSLVAAGTLAFAGDDKVRKKLVYQFGVHYDFNLRSSCAGTQEGDGVLFVGPLQDRAIIVRNAKSIPGLQFPLAQHEPPKNFEWTSCDGWRLRPH
jgi:hypothetical protein